jgi:LCP family protein required for cell wall assembly
MTGDPLIHRKYRNSPVWAWIAILAAAAACSFQDVSQMVPAFSPTATLMETPTETPTLTVSPTITLSPTTTVTTIPTEIPTSTITPTQILPGARYPETPVQIVREKTYPDGQVRVLIVIVDNSTPNTPRADSIHLVALNTRNDTASMLSIPSSLYVNIPDVGMERLYSSMIFGGAGKLLDTVEYNLGIRADRFIAVDFDHLGILVDKLGPINVPVEAQLTGPCSLPTAVNGLCTVIPGLIQMDKGMTLWYLHDRSGGEKDRMRRAQEVILASFTRLMDTQAPARAAELTPVIQSNLETDISHNDLAAITPISVAIYTNGQIRRAAFSDVEAVPFNLPDGQNVLLLDQNAAWNTIQQVILQP